MKLREFLDPSGDLDDDQRFLDRFPNPFLLEEGRPGSLEGQRHVYPLCQERVLVGRHPDSDICLESSLVSKHHAELRACWTSDGGWGLLDAGSTNGTYLNDLRLAAGEGRPLVAGDVVRFGEHRFTLLHAPELLAAVRRLAFDPAGLTVREDDPPQRPSQASLEELGERPLSGGEILQRDHREQHVDLFGESSERWVAILDSLPGALVVFDEKGHVSTLNKAAERLFGRQQQETVGLPVEVLLPHGSAPLLQALVLGQPRELPGCKADGTVFPIEVVVRRFDVGERCAYSMGVRDLTARRQAEFKLLRTEDALHHTQKMDAVGRLASGITHDFNNMLAVINGYSERLLATSLTERQRRSLERIQTAGERASALTRKLLSLTGRDLNRPEVIEPNGLIGDMLDMLESVIGERIRLRFFATPSVGCVRADKSQLEQVILNLVFNARDSMAKGGELNISTANTLLGPEQVEPHPGLEPGLYLRLSVSDTGTGIRVEDQERIFEPFFTTRPPGKARGLGLSVVYAAVKQNHGHVSVESPEGQGATFRVYLPVTREEVTPAAQPRQRPDTTTHCHETVLLVEDEEPVRELLLELLTEWGYHVLSAVDGEEGLEVARSYEGKIDALLTDVVMPRMSGPALAERLETLRPQTRILFMSGYLEEDPPPGWPVMAKPFSPRVLGSKLRELLDAAHERDRSHTSAMLNRLGRYFTAEA